LTKTGSWLSATFKILKNLTTLIPTTETFFLLAKFCQKEKFEKSGFLQTHTDAINQMNGCKILL
jgi:hypothetical protein